MVERGEGASGDVEEEGEGKGGKNARRGGERE